MKKILFSVCMLFSFSAFAYADLVVYGPGGPAPVIKELAIKFEAKNNEKVKVIAGPTPQWIESAKKDADIIFAGNSSMMDGFIKALPEALSHKNIQVLNAREAGLVVRKNNPKKIKTFDDVLKKGIRVMVVDGAGQVGLYEDMALKSGNSQKLRDLRKNIVYYAPNSKMAVDRWNSDLEIDALIIWSHWAKVLGEDKVEFIPLKKDAVIYRAAEIALSNTSKNKKSAEDFIAFIQSKDAQKVWEKWGWIAK